MEDNCKEFIISTFTWSFSRLESFYTCKYGWKKKYIDCEEGEGNAFAEYGTLMHSLLESYLKGETDVFDLATQYEERFDPEVPSRFPPNKFVDLRQSYYEKGLNYFESFTDVLDEPYEVIGVEKQVRFEIAGKPFVGYIDMLVRDSDGNILMLDHKSASSKFNKKNGKPAKSFEDKMLSYRRQQYLYCKALIDEGIRPAYLCWNFFNDGIVYRIPFDETEYQEALRWAELTIALIEAETDFDPIECNYYCKNICDYRHACEHCTWENWGGEAETFE